MRRRFSFALFVIVAVFGCMALYFQVTAIHANVGSTSLTNINIVDQASKSFVVDLMNHVARGVYMNQGVLIFLAVSIIVSSVSTAIGLIRGVSSVFWPRLCGIALMAYAVFVALFPHSRDGFSGVIVSLMGNGTRDLSGNGTYELSPIPIAPDAFQRVFWTVWPELQILFGSSWQSPRITFEVVLAAILGALVIAIGSLAQSRDSRF